MNLKQLTATVESLKNSSAFRMGDPTTFSVSILEDELSLPGPADPEVYGKLLKNKLSVVVAKGDRVIVMCAGNGGLAAWALEQGAAEVLAVEPRYRFDQILEPVVAALDEVHEEAVVRSFRSWPFPSNAESLGQFDLILWPEGLHECPQPALVMEAMADLLKPTGVMAIEVTHGQHAVSRDKVNAFYPSEDAWNGLVRSLTGELPSAETHGRAEKRMIYRIGRQITVGKVKADPKDPLPPFPRDPELETTYRTGSNLPPLDKVTQKPLPTTPEAVAPAPAPAPETAPETEPVAASAPAPEVSPPAPAKTTKKTTTTTTTKPKPSSPE